MMFLLFIVVPHEDESEIIVEDDTLDDDFVMPIACSDDYDWEDNDTLIILEIFLAPTWEIMMIAIVMPLVLFILLMMRVIMLMICATS